MRVKLLVFLLILFLSSTLAESVIGNEVYSVLESQEWVKVTIFIEDTLPPEISLEKNYVPGNMEEAYPLIANYNRAKKDEVLNLLGEEDYVPQGELDLRPVIYGSVSKKGLEKLDSLESVQLITLPRKMHASLGAPQDWSNPSVGGSVASINAHLAQPLVNNIRFQSVCVLDTGVDYTHSYMGNCSRTNDINRANCSVVVGGTDIINGDNDPYDDESHGTHVAGIIASTSPIATGVAKGINIVAIKVLDEEGNGDDVIAEEGVEWCIRNKDRLNISIISMSIGTEKETWRDGCYDPDYNAISAINTAYHLGIPSYVASGNDFLRDGINAPACGPRSFSVGSVAKYDASYALTDYTNRGPSRERGARLDLVAPGGGIQGASGIKSLWNKNNLHRSEGGTSMATPHVSGAAGLIKQYSMEQFGVDPTPMELYFLLNKSGVPIYDGETNITVSRIDVWAAINYLNTIQFREIASGEVHRKQIWRTNLTVPSTAPAFEVSLNQQSMEKVNLSLVAPNGTEYFSYDSSLNKKITINPAVSGEWIIKVKGHRWNRKPVPFTVSAKKVDSLYPAGIDFTSLNLNYISTCDPNNVQFVMEGQEGLPAINASQATRNAVDYFLAGLAIPNNDLWITMDHQPGNGPLGRVGDTSRVHNELKRTKLGQTLLAADVQLKRDQFGSPSGNYERTMMLDWIATVQASPYWNQIQAQGFNAFPQGFRRTWIYPEQLDATSRGCNVFVENVTLNIDYVWDAIYLDLSLYNFNQQIQDDLDARLLQWQQRHINGHLNQVTAQTVQKINSAPEYEELRRAAKSLAIAQWYKQQNRATLPFGNIIDSNNISSVEIPFDETYWNQQAWQYLYTQQNVPDFLGNNHAIDWYGGIEFGALAPNITGNISNHTQQVMDDTNIESFVRDNNVYFSTARNPNQPDLVPIALAFSSLTPDANAPTTVSVLVSNEGSVASTPTTVRFTDNSSLGLSTFSTVLLPAIAPSQHYQLNTTFTSAFMGVHKITVELDSQNAVVEFNEFNNERSEQIQVVDPLPQAQIYSPQNGHQAAVNSSLELIGDGYDVKDGTLNESLFRWVSDRDGNLGNGNVINASTLSLGEHRITLTVQDSDGNTNTHQVTISIVPSQPPVITLNSPLTSQMFEEGEIIYLDATANDPEDGSLPGSWNSSLDGPIANSNLVNIQNLSVGNHTLTYFVVDSSSTTAMQSVTIEIEESTPIVQIITPTNNSQSFFNRLLTLIGSAYDPHEGNLNSSLQWTSSLDGSLGTGNVLSRTLSVGYHLLTASVTDSNGLSNSHTVLVQQHAPLPPTVSILSPMHNSNAVNSNPLLLRSLVIDLDGNVTNVTWTSSLDGYLGSGEQLATSSLQIGTHQITAQATDNDGLTHVATSQITITSMPPQVSIQSPLSNEYFLEGSTITLSATATDLEDGTINTVEWRDGNNLIATAPLAVANLALGAHVITATVTDSHGVQSQDSVQVIVTSAQSNTLSTFSDGRNSQNVTFQQGGQQIVYVTLPKSATITSAIAQVEGLSNEE